MKNLIYTISFLFVFSACETEDYLGPDLNDIYGPLEIIQNFTISNDSMDFTGNNSTHFIAKFSKRVSWQININGIISGSKKIISGESNYIDESNSSWNGNSTTLPFFTEEPCEVFLTFKDFPDTSVNINALIINAKQYHDQNTVLISNFEAGFNPNFTGFFQAGCTKALTSGGAGEGIRFLQQFGTCDWDWLIGYIDYYSNFWFDQENLVSDPERVFFNIMIYGDSTLSDVTNLPNSVFKLEFYEDENGDGYYDASSEDRYDYEFDVDWNGWKMISISYNDMDKLILATNGGNNQRNPDKISNVRTLLLANPESGFAKADVDFLIWSFDSPLLD